MSCAADIRDLAKCGRPHGLRQRCACIPPGSDIGQSPVTAAKQQPVKQHDSNDAMCMADRVAATACIFFRRFYCRNDFCTIDPRCLAPAALYLAAKVEETLLTARYLFQLMQTLSSEGTLPSMILRLPWGCLSLTRVCMPLTSMWNCCRPLFYFCLLPRQVPLHAARPGGQSAHRPGDGAAGGSSSSIRMFIIDLHVQLVVLLDSQLAPSCRAASSVAAPGEA